MRNNDKDWTGNSHTTYSQLGATNHSDTQREQRDYYATDPIAAWWLLQIEDIPHEKPIWECAAGERHLANVFEQHGYTVRASDIIARCSGVEEYDFLTTPLLGNITPYDGTIITNPPYRYAQEFIQRAIEIVTPHNLVCMSLRLLFLESGAHRQLFDRYPPRTVWVSSHRIICAINGDFKKCRTSAVAYAWYIWEKGYTGQTALRFFN